MKYGVATKSAAEASFSNPCAALLTMLGIIIGVASVMVMMSIGEGAKVTIEKQINSVGTNVLTLQPGSMNRGGRNQGGSSGRPFSESDVDRRRRPVLRRCARPGSSPARRNAVSEEANWATQIQGGTAPTSWSTTGRSRKAASSPNRKPRAARPWSCSARRPPTTSSRAAAPSASASASTAFPSKSIGILEIEGARAGGGGMGQDRDDTIIGPLRMVRNRITGGNRWVSVTFPHTGPRPGGYDVPQAQDEATTMMRERRRVEPGQPGQFHGC